MRMALLQLSDINAQTDRDEGGCVLSGEARYHGEIERLAAGLAESGRRLVLLAGPSGSGKTTSANLLADAMRKAGKTVSVLSLDDFYREATDPAYPRLPNGERDFETVEALHLPDLTKTLSDIARGEAFAVPRYDFKTGTRVTEKHHPPLKNGCVIIEGLHALNPKISESLPADAVYKLFISVASEVAEEGRVLLDGRQIRFVRRLVRDSLYRGSDAGMTLALWRDVVRGEDLYLSPYRETADAGLDTFHVFELGVMRPYALSLLDDAVCTRSDYAKKVRLALEKVHPVSILSVPEDSLIREFIPGGIYEHLY